MVINDPTLCFVLAENLRDNQGQWGRGIYGCVQELPWEGGWERKINVCACCSSPTPSFLQISFCIGLEQVNRCCRQLVEFVSLSFLSFLFVFSFICWNELPAHSCFNFLPLKLPQRNSRSKCRLQTQIRPPVIGRVVAYYLLIWSTARNDIGHKFGILKSRTSLMLKTPGHATLGWRSWCSHH